MDQDDDSKIFPQRLMEILSDERNLEAISWLPHGRAFAVRDRDLFAKTVMPRYFSRNAKYSSFTRKLNRWNFVRVSSGPEVGAYYHEFFLRDKPHLSAQMFCKNARSKLAMDSDIIPPSSVKPAPGPAQAAAAPSPPTTPDASKPAPASLLPPDIPLALLEFLSKAGPSIEPRHQPTGPVPSLLLQQSQYANLLLERQIQILQQEQAKLFFVQKAMAIQQQQRKPVPNEARLRQMVELQQLRQKQQGRGGHINHRASAA